MNIREFAKPVTSKSLNESLAKRFGTKINVDAFTLEQLQDARNKLRTKLSQVETNESFDTVHKDKGYQKSKLFLDVLNAAIIEREDVMEKGAKPDYIDIDGDGNKKEPMKKAVQDKKKKKIGEMSDEEKAAKKQKARDSRVGATVDQKMDADAEVTHKGMQKKKKATDDLLKFAGIKKESVIREGEEDKAELVMAAKDMVDRLTGWMEDTAEMQSESMLELADAIRDEMGQQESDGFVNTVKPALEQLYAAMESTRQSLTSGVGMLTGEGGAPDMGGEIPADEGEAGAADLEPTVDQEAPADEFAASAPAAGGEAEAGRAKRESIERSRRIGTILSSRNVVIR